MPARNTIKTVSDGQVKETLPRSRLWEIQTPQAFPVRTLREAYASAEREGVEATDDAMLVGAQWGAPVWVVDGSTVNLKVTYPEDILFAEALVAGGGGLRGRRGPWGWRPRRDLNPCCRRERPVSWARLDDGDRS